MNANDLTSPKAYPYAWGVTTSAKGGAEQIEAVKGIADKYHTLYLPREGHSLRELQAAHGLDYIVTLDRNMRLYVGEPPVCWHPSLSLKRLRRLAEGGRDVFLSAVSLERGDRYLDCTLGFGADAILAAWAAGETGEVLGLEASPIIALLSEWGLKYDAPGFQSKKTPVAEAAGRIRVLAEEALAFLRSQPEGAWDVIYFDPMFRAANMRSSGMNSIRPLANHEPFSASLLSESLRICTKRVVLKERWFSPLFQQLGAHHTVKTKYGPVAYGIWDKPGGGGG